MKHFLPTLLGFVLTLIPFILPAQSTTRLYVGWDTILSTPNPPRSDAAISNSAWASLHGSVAVSKRDNYSATVRVVSYFTDIAEIQCDYYYYWYYGSSMMSNHSTTYFRVECLPVTVRISQSSLNMIVGDDINLSCSYSPSNVSPKPSLQWRSTDTRVATVSNGYVKAVGQGSCEIEVLNNMGPKASCPVTVSKIEPKEIYISDSRISLGPGQTRQLSARVYPSGVSASLSWKSSDRDVATVSSSGLVEGVAPGTADITVSTSNGLSDVCHVTVKEVKAKSISLSETRLFIPEGSGQLLKATLNPSDATEKVTWSSSDENVVTVSASGYVKGLTSGKATITAKAGVAQATCSVIVQPQPDAVSLPESLTLPQGTTRTLTATLEPQDAYSTLTWSSSDNRIASVSDKGVVTGVSMGEARITVRTANGLESNCAVTVTEPIPPTEIRLSKVKIKLVTGYYYKLSSSLRPDDSYSPLIWDSEDPSIASVTSGGLVKAVSAGNTRVTVKTNNELEATCIVEVEDPADPESEATSAKTLINAMKSLATKALNNRVR